MFLETIDEFVTNPEYAAHILERLTSKKPNTRVVYIHTSRGNGKPTHTMEELMKLVESGATVVSLSKQKKEVK